MRRVEKGTYRSASRCFHWHWPVVEECDPSVPFLAWQQPTYAEWAGHASGRCSSLAWVLVVDHPWAWEVVPPSYPEVAADHRSKHGVAKGVGGSWMEGKRAQAQGNCGVGCDSPAAENGDDATSWYPRIRFDDCVRGFLSASAVLFVYHH